MNLPRVSIVIPCYNAQQYVEQCVQSATDQNYENLEIIVVDDGSTDLSVQRLQKFSDVRLVRQKNQGACVARNNGLDLASGKYVKFLDADDFLEPGAIASQVRDSLFLAANTITYGNYISLSSRGRPLRPTKLLFKNCIHALVAQDITTSTPLHRKSFLERVGGFDESLKRGQDWNLHVRLAASGVRFSHQEDTIYTYRSVGQPGRVSRIGNDDPMVKFRLKIEQVMLTAEALKSEEYLLRDEAWPALAKRLWITGRQCLRINLPSLAMECFESADMLCASRNKYLPSYYRLGVERYGADRVEKINSRLPKLIKRLEQGIWRRSSVCA